MAASTVVDSFMARLIVHIRILLQNADIAAQHACRGVRSLIDQAALDKLTYTYLVCSPLVEMTLPSCERQDSSSSSRLSQRTSMEGLDLEGNNHGGRTSANKVMQDEELFDLLPVHKAAEQGDISVLASLVHSVENNSYDTYGECTPLHLAIHGDHAEVVKILLKAGADPEKVNYSDTAVDPPHPALDLAAWLGSCKSLRVLIDHGVVVSLSSLVLAASLHLTDCMRIILQELNKEESLYDTRQGCMRTVLI